MRWCATFLVLVAAGAMAWTPAPAAAQNRVELASGYEPDPWTTRIELRSRYSNAPRNIDERGVACLGGFDGVDVELRFTAGNLGLPLIISAGSSVDTALVVEDPHGRAFCDDDSGALGNNPMLAIAQPISGRYRIWVGVYRDPNTGAYTDVPAGATALISISELYSQ